MSRLRSVTPCGVEIFSCTCRREENHEGPHECLCGGEWYGETVAELVAVTLPFRFPLKGEEDEP